MKKFVLEIQLLRSLQIKFEEDPNHENTFNLVKQEIIIDEILEILLAHISQPDSEYRDFAANCQN